MTPVNIVAGVVFFPKVSFVGFGFKFRYDFNFVHKVSSLSCVYHELASTVLTPWNAGKVNALSHLV